MLIETADLVVLVVFMFFDGYMLGRVMGVRSCTNMFKKIIERMSEGE